MEAAGQTATFTTCLPHAHGQSCQRCTALTFWSITCGQSPSMITADPYVNGLIRTCSASRTSGKVPVGSSIAPSPLRERTPRRTPLLPYFLPFALLRRSASPLG
jgi:hypothetical protein